MGKLRVFSGDELCELLTRYGFQQVRQRGSHRVMQRKTETETTTIPVPLHRALRKGTLLSIIRQSGLERSLFET